MGRRNEAQRRPFLTPHPWRLYHQARSSDDLSQARLPAARPCAHHVRQEWGASRALSPYAQQARPYNRLRRREESPQTFFKTFTMISSLLLRGNEDCSEISLKANCKVSS